MSSFLFGRDFLHCTEYQVKLLSTSKVTSERTTPAPNAVCSSVFVTLKVPAGLSVYARAGVAPNAVTATAAAVARMILDAMMKLPTSRRLPP